MRRQLFDEWREIGIEEDETVLGMVDDVDELLGKQARIDRMQDAAGAGHPIIKLEMSPRIPGKRGDAFAWADPKRGESIGDALGTRRDLPVIGPVHDARRI